MKILVVGGAGYVGSHMVKLLLKHDHFPVTFDNLSSGRREAVLGGEFFLGNIADESALNNIFSDNEFDAVMHFASFIQVAESVADPGKYYANNVANTLTLLQAMIRHGVHKIVFSSSAAVYGDPKYLPLDELHPIAPRNPYGWSKAMIEQILADFNKAYGLRSISFRYFNAAGADPEGALGEDHAPETHLIPLVLQAASGGRQSVLIYGEDYATKDGTCVRDYIHVCDLCDAHLLGLEYLARNDHATALNLGTSCGYSVREIIDVAQAVCGRAVQVKTAPRRLGDPATLVADSTKAFSYLGWKPRFADLQTIIEHAWNWEQIRSLNRQGGPRRAEN